MQALIISLFVWAMANAIPRLLTGAGLAVIGFTFLNGLISDALTYFSTTLSSGGQYVQLLYMAGVGEAVSIIGSSILTLAAIQSARVLLGRTQ